jgi:chromosome segregation ATPase
MTDVLIPIVLLVSVATLFAAISTLRSSRRAEHLGENRFELLSDQQERLQVLRDERLMLIEELKRESTERQQLVEILKGEGPKLAENLEQVRKKRLEIAHRAEQQEQERLRLEQELRSLGEELERRKHQESQRLTEGLQREHNKLSQLEQEVERLEQERQRLTEDLEREREGRAEIQRHAERRDQERMRIEQEVQRLQAELDRTERAPKSGQAKSSEELPLWRRRPVLVVGLLFGIVVAWLVSLVVALSLLTS